MNRWLPAATLSLIPSFTEADNQTALWATASNLGGARWAQSPGVKVLPLLIVAGSPDYHPAAKAKIATLVFDCLRPLTLRTDIDDFTANRVPVVIGAMQRERPASAGFELHVGKNVARAALVASERRRGAL
jgi:hypothetical protein